MARRPVFVPRTAGPGFVEERIFEFQWHAGFSLAQKQRSIHSLHESAADAGVDPVLEISSKSPLVLGTELSAFNLVLGCPDGRKMPVENAFQGSKVFEGGGPFTDLFTMHPRDAKRDPRLKGSGRLKAFDLCGARFPLEPKTVFYDWLYLNALADHPRHEEVLGFRGFSDIEFNPERSINCQARSAAMFVGLWSQGLLGKCLANVESYLDLVLEAPHDDAAR